jgi:hypothetical protein
MIPEILGLPKNYLDEKEDVLSWDSLFLCKEPSKSDNRILKLSSPELWSRKIWFLGGKWRWWVKFYFMIEKWEIYIWHPKEEYVSLGDDKGKK